jgi:dCTP deaminase
MILKQERIITRLKDAELQGVNPLFIIPCPFSGAELSGEVQASGAASIDLRLGTWFLVASRTKIPFLEISKPSRVELALSDSPDPDAIPLAEKKRLQAELEFRVRPSAAARPYHVRFGDDFILHPRSFALASTLEWLRIPTDLAGYVTGRSSLGRRGLIIATAVGVHPGFTGCLTLELANLGDVPISVRPGMTIGQLFIHKAEGPQEPESVDRSSFYCKRRPILGDLAQDDIALALAKGYRL